MPQLADYNRIAADARHSDVVLLHYEEIAERRFAGWSMGQVNMARLNPALLLADAASRPEVMLTPPVPMSVALPPAAMSEPLMASWLPAMTERFPPLVSVVPLKVSVLLDELLTFFLPVRAEALVVSVVVTPVMETFRLAESDASPPAETRAASRMRSRPAETTRLPVAASSAPVTVWVVLLLALNLPLPSSVRLAVLVVAVVLVSFTSRPAARRILPPVMLEPP